MVSHPVVVAATSPVVTTSPAPTSTMAPLMTSLSMPPAPHAIIPESSKLHNLFDLGTKRFSNDDDDLFDADLFADIYVRTLQAALRGSALRNQTLARKLKSIRQANANMRATKCEERVAAQRRADAAAKQAKKQNK